MKGQVWVRLAFTKNDVAENVMLQEEAGGGDGLFRIWVPEVLVPEDMVESKGQTGGQGNRKKGGDDTRRHKKRKVEEGGEKENAGPSVIDLT